MRSNLNLNMMPSSLSDPPSTTNINTEAVAGDQESHKLLNISCSPPTTTKRRQAAPISNKKLKSMFHLQNGSHSRGNMSQRNNSDNNLQQSSSLSKFLRGIQTTKAKVCWNDEEGGAGKGGKEYDTPTFKPHHHHGAGSNMHH